jgi:biotin operon repressor
MEVSKFRKAMRPKKYLTRDFVVYQDPKRLAARSEMQAGGVVEREGFSVGQGARTDLGEKGVKELPSNMKRIFDIVYPEKNWEDLSSRQRGNFIYDFPRREKILNSIPKNYITLDELAEKLNIKRISINEPRTTLGKFINQNLQPQTFGNITGKGGGFTKYYKDPGVRLTKQILRIAGQDVRIDNLRKNTVRNINKLYTTYYDDFYKKGLVPNIEDIKIMSASEAGNATTRLAQILDGKKFKNKGLEKIRVNKKVANRLFEELSKFQFGNPYQSQLYKISLETIDQKLGNKKGTFNDLKNKAKNILKENKIPIYDVKSKNPYGFNINEIAGVTGSAKSKAPEFSQFIDIMEGELNQKDLAAFQSVLSRARGDIELNPNALQKQMRKVNSYASNLEKKFDVQLPRIRKAEDITKYYTPKRLEELKKQGLDIVSASKRAGYTIQMPKGAVTAQEFVEGKKIQKKIIQGINESSPQDLTDFISTLAPGCKLKYADGGRVNYSTGSDCYNRGLEMLKQASQGDKTTAQKVGQNLKQFGKATGKLARFVELPLEIALEGVLIGWDSTFNAKPLAESIKDNGIVTRAIFSDFQTSGEQDRAANIAKQNPQAAKYVEAKEALDKYNKLKNAITPFKDNLASANNYQNAVVKFEEYENEIRDKIPQYTAMLTPGSPEYEAFKEARIQLETDRIEKTYGDAQEMEELMQPFEGATDVADIQKAKAEELQGNIENVSSTYNFGPTFEEFRKEFLPKIYKQTGSEKNPRNDALFEQYLKKQYDDNLKLFSRPQFSKGGLTRRGFLKVIGALTALAAVAKTGVMKLTSPVAKKVLKDAPQGTPDWFAPLVEKIMKEGIDISDKAATIERQVVKELKTPDGTYTITETPDTGEIIVSVDTGAGVNDFPVDFTMTPNRITGVADDGTPITEFGEFNVVEFRAEGRQVSPDGDYDIEPGEYITNDLDDAASDWHSVEKFATGKTDEIAQKKKQDGKEFIEKNPGDDIVNRYGDYDPPEPEPDDFYD